MTRLEQAGRDPDGGQRRWVLHLLPLEATLLRSLPDQVAGLLADPDGNRRIIDRLFPASYSDAEEERQNRRLLSDALLEARQELLTAVRAELSKGRSEPKGGLALSLEPGSIDLWLRFFNDVRLILATDLGIERNLGQATLDPSDADAPKLALLEYLTGVEALLIEAAGREF